MMVLHRKRPGRSMREPPMWSAVPSILFGRVAEISERHEASLQYALRRVPLLLATCLRQSQRLRAPFVLPFAFIPTELNQKGKEKWNGCGRSRSWRQTGCARAVFYCQHCVARVGGQILVLVLVRGLLYLNDWFLKSCF